MLKVVIIPTPSLLNRPSATPRHHMPKPSRHVPGPHARAWGKPHHTHRHITAKGTPANLKLSAFLEVLQQWRRMHSEAGACVRTSYSNLGAQGAFKDRRVTHRAAAAPPPNALPRAPLAHPRNCIALRTMHCGARTVAVPSSARLEIDATVLRRNAALAVVWRPLHTAPISTAAPMQLMVRPRSSSGQDTTASKCRRSPCCNCRGGEMRATSPCLPELPRTQLTSSRGPRTMITLARNFTVRCLCRSPELFS